MNSKKTSLVKKVMKLLSVLVLSLCVIDGVALAQTGNFSVHAVIPDNQVDKRQTYFDLRMQPGGKQTIQVVIDNSRTEDLTARVQINPATTGRNGQIIYSESDVWNENRDVMITDVASLTKDIVIVPAESSLTVDIDIEMPPEYVAGTLLGGIVVTEENTDTDVPAEGVSVLNTVSYVVGLKITENDDPVVADFELISIVPSLVNYKTAVVTTLQNNAPLIVKDLEVKAQIYASGEDTPLHELFLENTEMAPLSRGDYVIDWENKPLGAGNYRMNMTANYQGQEWTWDETFAIAAEAMALNSEAVGLERNYSWIYVVVGCIVLAIVAYIAYWAGRRNIRREE